MTILITGGSGSGKSKFAEQLLHKMHPGRKVYIATMHAYDAESMLRIDRHRRQREGLNFSTLEQYVDIGSAAIEEGAAVLLECISNLTANEMFDPGASGAGALSAVVEGVRALKQKSSILIIVTNEIFSDGYLYSEETREYQKCLGAVNTELAEMSDHVFEVVYGVPVHLKGACDESLVEQL